MPALLSRGIDARGGPHARPGVALTSRRPSHREHNPQWVGGPKAYRRGQVTTVSCNEILKECYPPHRIGGGPSPIMERSWGAKLARERHWITWEQYFKFPIVDTGRRTKGGAQLYVSPFLALLKRTS